MTDKKDWRRNISFSDRLSVTSKMQSRSAAYKTSNPDSPASEVSKFAKKEEETARKKSSSLAEYHATCSRVVERLHESTPSASQEQSVEIVSTTDQASHGAQIGRFMNATHHRHGLFSDIFRATDPTSGSIVALKVTNPSIMTAPHDSVREARILTAAKGPNIVPLFETFQQAGGRFILVFPFMQHDLGTLLHNGALPTSVQRPLLQALFSALAHLHKQDIIHRDVKPSNILLASPTGPFYLADFGVAWSANDPASEVPHYKYLEVGTTSYRAPEVLFGCQTYGPALDLWAAGCVAAQVLCLGAETLFEAGDLGSELALIKSIFETLGTPDVAEWPDWGKMSFTKYPSKTWHEILPGISEEARGLVKDLVRYESENRQEAEKALRHPYFQVASP